MYENKDNFTIARMAKVLDVSESGYYKWVNRKQLPASDRELTEQQLREEIREHYFKSRGSFGRRKVTSLINKSRTVKVNHKRIGRIMYEEGWLSKAGRKYCCTTDSRHDNPIAENLLDRDFSTTAANQKMVSDTTMIDTNEGWLYVAGILDLHGRMPVGFAMSSRNDTALIIDAYNDMIRRGAGAPGCILHSDRGSTYTSKEYLQLLKKDNFKCSMSRKGDCWDNSPMECFWGKLKAEWMKKRYNTRAEAMRDVYQYVWFFYRKERPNAALNYMTPLEYCSIQN